MVELIIVLIAMLFLFAGGGWLLSRRIKPSTDDTPAWVLGFFSAVLIIPFLFWTGFYFFHARIDYPMLVVCAIILFLFQMIWKNRTF